jgi:hypothetical protein
VVIPWFDGQGEDDRLCLLKIRQPVGRTPKYVEVFRDRPALFPGLSVIQPGWPLVIVEGEFDALLLGQELADLPAAVATFGSASSSGRPAPEVVDRLLTAAPWFLAADADSSGDRACDDWYRRARRVLPPAPFKDWTEAFQGGVDLRSRWLPFLRPTR